MQERSSPYQVDIRFCEARKSIALYVHEDAKVQIEAPPHVDYPLIHDFVKRKDAWIQRRLFLLQQRSLTSHHSFNHGQTVYLLGQAHTIHGTDKVGQREPRLFAKRLIVPKSTEGIEQRVQRWLANFGEVLMTQRLQSCYREIKHWGIDCPQLKIIAMRSRWGAYSLSGEISLNLALIHYPLACIDYVIYHELCHVLEFNHGPAFYSLLEQACPNWQEQQKILRTW